MCRFGSGISSQGCLLDAAEATGVVSRKGSWYYYGERRMAQGRDKTLLELAASVPLAECARPGRAQGLGLRAKPYTAKCKFGR